MAIMHDLEKANKAQFIIATHSPILLSYSGATIFNLDDGLKQIDYEDTEHYKFIPIIKMFGKIENKE
jgi:predicted ATPase